MSFQKQALLLLIYYAYLLCYFRRLVQDYGIWTQLRVDKGKEWYLMLFVQAKLAHHRNDTSKPSFLQTSSKQGINICL